MATTNTNIKITQGLSLQGALFVHVGGAVAFAPLSYEVQGNNVKFTFGVPFSFVVNAGTTITKLEVIDQETNTVILNEALSIVVEKDDVVFIDEVSFTLLD